MIVSIHQPAYLPWLGYIEKMKHCDVFVVLDTVQFEKDYFDNRNKILLNGEERWLTIPIYKSGHSKQILLDTKPLNYDWMRNHLQLIKEAYQKAPNFNKYFPVLKDLYDLSYTVATDVSTRTFDGDSGPSLAEVDWWFLGFFQKAFNIKAQVIRAKDMHMKGRGSDLNLNICQRLGADTYYSGIMGKNYLDEPSFKTAGIKIEYQEYKPPNNYSALHQLFTVGAKL